MSEILVVIPAYNEEKNISRVVDHLIQNHPDLDYLIVNDGSKDHTRAVCLEKGYQLLDLPVNLGLAGGFQAGLKYAYQYNYHYAVQFDGDGQHRPEYIHAMKAKMQEGYDIVIGSRYLEEKKDWSLRMLGSRMISLATWMTTGVKVQDPTSGMRMFNRKMIEEFALSINYGPEPDTISYLLKQGASITEVPVKMDDRVEGESYLKPMNAIKYMIKMLISIVLIQNFRKRDKRFEDENIGGKS